MSQSPSQLQAALQALYYHADPTVKEQANQWLEQWQQSQEAWQISYEILQNDSLGLETHYFAAQTLRTKVRRDFEELPSQTALSLRDSLVNLLVHHSKGQSQVKTQLSLAIAALATHLPRSSWAPHSGVVEWLTHRFSTEPTDIALTCMLELLTVLPQEASMHQSTLRPERRREMREEMTQSVPLAMDTLSKCLSLMDNNSTTSSMMGSGGRGSSSSSSSSIAHSRVLDAFAAWLKLSGGAGLTGQLLISSPLVSTAIQGLSSTDEIFYAATDAVIELIYCSSTAGHPREDMVQLVQMIVQHIIALRPRFHVCMQQALSSASGGGGSGIIVNANHTTTTTATTTTTTTTTTINTSSDYEEDAKAIARLFAEVGEAYTDLIATGTPESMLPVDALLDVASHPDDEICAISFNFWHRLSRVLTQELRPRPLFADDDEQHPGLSKDESIKRLSLFAPTFERLVSVIRGRVKFPDDFDEWHRVEREEFRMARVRIGDVLDDATAVLGSSTTLRLLVEPLIELSARIQAIAHNTSITNNAAMLAEIEASEWRTAEAALYCIRCIHRHIPPAGDPLLMSLFTALPTLMPNQSKLVYTVALTVSSYADWLAECCCGGGEGIALVDALVRMLIRGLSFDECSSACALSLRRICESCSSFLTSTVPILLDLYQQVQITGDIRSSNTNNNNNNNNSTNTTTTLDLDEEDVEHIIEAVTLVVSSLPEKESRESVQRMMDIIVQPIQEILQTIMQQQQNNTNTDNDSQQLLEYRMSMVLPLMDRLTALLRVVKDPADVAAALTMLWPWIEIALNVFGQKSAAAEKICRVPRYALRSAGKHARDAVPSLSESLPSRFEATQHSCYLYVSSELIKIFGDDSEMDVYLGRMMERLLLSACALLPSFDAVTNRPDVTDDTFLLACRGLNYAPRLIITPRILPALLHVVCVGLLVQHREAFGSICAFVVRLLDPSTRRRCSAEVVECLQHVFPSHLHVMVRMVLAGGTGELPTSRLRELVDVLYALMKAAGNNAVEVASQALRSVPDEALPKDDCERFLLVCQKVVMNSLVDEDEERALLDAMVELSDVCRRNRKVQSVVSGHLLGRN